MGRLEVFHNNEWGTVCDDFFSFREAGVVCGMLNYTRALCSVPAARFGQGTGNSQGCLLFTWCMREGTYMPRSPFSIKLLPASKNTKAIE